MKDKECYIYLLIEKNTNNCKIGISIDSYKRSKVIPQDIDYEKSITCLYKNKKVIYLEKLLHNALDKYRIHTMVGDGHTEWFLPEAFDIAKSLISSMKESLSLSEWEKVIKLKKVYNEKPVSQKKIKKPKKVYEEDTDYIGKNLIEFNRLENMIKTCASINSKFNISDDYIECLCNKNPFENLRDLFCSIFSEYGGLNIISYVERNDNKLKIKFLSIDRIKSFANKHGLCLDYYENLYSEYGINKASLKTGYTLEM